MLLRNLRKTERGANQFLACFVVRAAPFALLRMYIAIGSRMLKKALGTDSLTVAAQ